MRYLLDTNIYIEACRSGEKRNHFRRTFFPLLPVPFLSAVVAYEMYVNAQDRHSRCLVQEFTDPMQHTGRVVSPTFTDWIEASAIVTDIGEKDRGWRSKLLALLNDILIPLCARRAGAILFPDNEDNFRLPRRHHNFSLRILET